MRSWSDESLLRRPPQEDSLRHRAGHAKGSSGPPVRRGPLLAQALRKDRQRREAAQAQKEPWTAQQDRRGSRLLLERDVEERQAATMAQRRRFLEHITATTLSDSTVRRPMKRLGYSQKTDCGALERDEFFRATWKVMVAEQVEPERLVFIEEMGTNIALSPSCLPSTPGRRKAGGPLVRASQPGSQHHLAI
jgi:hypothetical protein